MSETLIMSNDRDFDINRPKKILSFITSLNSPIERPSVDRPLERGWLNRLKRFIADNVYRLECRQIQYNYYPMKT